MEGFCGGGRRRRRRATNEPNEKDVHLLPAPTTRLIDLFVVVAVRMEIRARAGESFHKNVKT